MKINAPKKEMKAFNEKQVVGKIIAIVLYLINEMELVGILDLSNGSNTNFIKKNNFLGLKY